MIDRVKLVLVSHIWILLIFVSCAPLRRAVPGPRERLKISIVSPLVKVFPDTFPQDTVSPVLYLECAANEYEPAQFLIRSAATLEGVSINLSDLESEHGYKIPSCNLHWNFEGFIPLDINTPESGRESNCGVHDYVPKGEIIRKAPCEIPDPLLDDKSIVLKAGRTQPVWITAHVPPGTPAGIYSGNAKIMSPTSEIVIPIKLKVYPFELPDERHMYLTNMFEIGHIASAHKVEKFSDEFWDILKRYASNMAEHRQNVVYTPWQLVKVFQESEDSFSFDYSNFDRFVETFIEAGVVGRIEILYIAHRVESENVEWRSAPMIFYEIKVIDRVSGDTLSIPGERGLPSLLTYLQKHLDKKGWLEKSMIHVSDEPTYYNVDSWKKVASYPSKYAPDIKTIDAIYGAIGFDGLLDIGVPLSSHLHVDFETYKKFQKSGHELWFYTCCEPYGHYPNRFLDYPLTDLRVLHWMNYKYGIEGYLHWGFTYGWDDPFGVAKVFPPGDSHIIYPGENGPMNSIRWEIQREGLEDYEYFWLLESKVKKIKKELGPAADSIPSDFRSKEICGMLVKSLADYNEDPEAFYSIRKLLATEISKIDEHPLVLFTTTPNTNTPLLIGPAEIKIYGVVEEQTEVKVNGKEVNLKSDGSFIERIALGRNNGVIRIEVDKDGKKKVLKRKFNIE